MEGGPLARQPPMSWSCLIAK